MDMSTENLSLVLLIEECRHPTMPTVQASQDGPSVFKDDGGKIVKKQDLSTLALLKYWAG